MVIGFVGAGRVSTAAGFYFNHHGIEVSGFYSRSYDSAKNSASKTNTQAYCELADLLSCSDVVFVTTPDDAIETAALEMSNLPAKWDSLTVCHMSGLHSSDILLPLRQKGATVCSLHPMLAFADFESSVKALASAPFTLEGIGPGIDKIKNLLDKCGNKYTQISSGAKPLYHAAACVISNYMVAIVDAGMEMLKTAGFPPESVSQLIQPLILKTVDNIINLNPEKALTGPISRGDSNTVEKHLACLSLDGRQWIDLYRILGIKTVELAQRGGKIDEFASSRLKEVLEKYE